MRMRPLETGIGKMTVSMGELALEWAWPSPPEFAPAAIKNKSTEPGPEK